MTSVPRSQSVPFPPLAGSAVAVVAHRGASQAARENTVEAYVKARALRADGVELDVRRTADHHLAVHHDALVPDVGPIVEHRWSDLVRVAPWIPDLASALDACAPLWVNVEIKNLPMDPDWDPDEWVAGAVARLVAEREAYEQVIVSSFNPAALARVREVEPSVSTALLSIGRVDAVLAVDAAAEAGHAALHPAVESMAGEAAEAVVRRGQALGVAIVPWTVNDPEEITRLADAGVAGVITDVPEVARAALAE